MPYSRLRIGKRVLPTSQLFLLHHKTEMKGQGGTLGLRSSESQSRGADPCSGDLYVNLAKGDGEGTIFIHSGGIPPAKLDKLQNMQVILW